MESLDQTGKEYLTIEQRKVVNWYRKILQNKDTPLWELDASDLFQNMENYGPHKVGDPLQYFSEQPKELVKLAKQLKIQDLNDEALNQFGYSSVESFLAISTKYHIHDYDSALKIIIMALLSGQQFIETEAIATHKNGHQFNIKVQFIWPETLHESQNIVVSVEEIAEGGPLSVKRFHRPDVYKSFVDNAPVCIHEVDLDGRLQDINGTGLVMMNMQSVSDIKGLPYIDVVAEEDKPRVQSLLERAYAGYSSEFEFKITTNAGQKIFTSCFIPLDLKDGKAQRIIGVTQDITEKIASEQELYTLANFDPLTGLRNRRNFTDTANQYIAQATRHGHKLAFLFFDLDKFKAINDQYGHGFGDTVLQQVANCLRHNLRKEDLLCRYAGDEFVALLPYVNELSHVQTTADSIHEKLSTLAKQLGDNIELSTSIGISFFPDHGKDLKSLIHSSDTAMYKAKEQGGKQHILLEN